MAAVRPHSAPQRPVADIAECRTREVVGGLMAVVYDLWFTREYDDRDDTELHIGIYATRGDAEAAIDTLRIKPGFRDYPEGFEAHEIELGHTGWQYGFVTTIGPPPKDAAGEAFDLPAFD